jgi:hypothetical protein|tara:strand:- start:659 stop:991 length:333 start_codon:yes stop_codon:yes gene_type:complete
LGNKNRKASGFFDTATWEEVKKKKGSDIEKWIDYEITASHQKGNGISGIYIHKKNDSTGNTSTKGRNPFKNWEFRKAGKVIEYQTYDWIDDDGYNNMGDWIETAAKAVGR